MYHILDQHDIKELINTMPKVLMFNSYNDYKSSSDTKFSTFNNLPEDIRLKIGAMAKSPSFFKTEKSYLSSVSGKQTYYDIACTNTGPTLKEFNKYLKSLPKNIKTYIGCMLIFKNSNFYKLHWVIVEVELTDKNILNIYYFGGARIRTLITPVSFMDFCIENAGLPVDYELVTVLFDYKTIREIVSKRKICMEVDNLYDHKYAFSYTDAIMQHFRDYFGPLSTFLSISLAALSYSIPNNLYVETIKTNQNFNTHFFISNDGNKEKELSAYSNYILEKLQGPNNIYVDERFLI